MEELSITVVGAMIQMVGVWALTGLFLFIRRAMDLPYLQIWARAWLCMSLSLTALQISFRVPSLAPFLQPIYFAGELAFLWQLYQGLRRLAALPEQPFPKSAWALAGVYALALPHVLEAFTRAFVVHASIFAVALLLMAWHVHQHQADTPCQLGLRLTLFGLLLLAAVFTTHVLLLSLVEFLGVPLLDAYARFTSLYDFLAEMLLAFGLVVLTLQDAAQRIRQLVGLLPVCGWCRKIRNDQGYWTEFEAWVKTQGVSDITHSICPECRKQAFPDYPDGE